MYKKIVVPLDGSELSKVALPHACEIARAFGASVTLLSVIEPIVRAYFWATDPYGLLAAESAAEYEEHREHNVAEAFLNQIKEEMSSKGIEIKTEVLDGDPGSEICDYVVEHKADMIIMSTHGRSGVKRWVYGSVAEKVLHGADVPVLLVRSHTKQQEAEK
ncbi:MAG TPA: universal stress protein [Armatimonadota bacterium]|nr:universal stress protein [Armatimonadota bacterium]